MPVELLQYLDGNFVGGDLCEAVPGYVHRDFLVDAEAGGNFLERLLQPFRSVGNFPFDMVVFKGL